MTRAQTWMPMLDPSQQRPSSPEDPVMAAVDPPVGRRERNKQAKLERITTAASELFA